MPPSTPDTFTAFPNLPYDLRASIYNACDPCPKFPSVAKSPTFGISFTELSQVNRKPPHTVLLATGLHTPELSESFSDDARVRSKHERMWKEIENGTVKHLVFAAGVSDNSGKSPGFMVALTALDHIQATMPNHSIQSITIDETIEDGTFLFDSESEYEPVNATPLSTLMTSAQDLILSRPDLGTTLQVRVKPDHSASSFESVWGAPFTATPTTEQIAPTIIMHGSKRLRAPLFQGPTGSDSSHSLNFDITGTNVGNISSKLIKLCSERLYVMDQALVKEWATNPTTTINLYASPSSTSHSNDSSHSSILLKSYTIKTNDEVVSLKDNFDAMLAVAQSNYPPGTGTLILECGRNNQLPYNVQES